MNSKSRFGRKVTGWISLFILLAFITASFGTAEAKSSKTVKVPATVQWVNTGIRLTAGQKVTIVAKGSAWTIKSDPKTKCNPNGNRKYLCGSDPGAPPPCAMNYAPYGQLVGKIGYGLAFRVGKKISFTASTAGILYLSVNDNLRWYSDNAGGYTATILVK